MPELLALLLMLWPAAAPSGEALLQEGRAPAVRYDSSRVAVRRPPANALEAYRRDAAFQYERAPVGEGWWARFRAWLYERLFGPLEGTGAGRAVEWIVYALAAVGVVFAVVHLLGMTRHGLFSRRAHRRPVFEAVEEGVASPADFERRIEEAVAAGDYRHAVRLLYRQALGRLAERDLIRWQRNKTNWTYVDELRPAGLNAPFAELTHLFEYVWYGDVPVDPVRFSRVREAFARFNSRLPEET